MEITSIGNPRYTANGDIDVTIVAAEIGPFEFTASASDSDPFGQEIYQQAKTGEYGEIAIYVEPAVPEEQVVAQVVAERNRQLQASDWTQLPDVPLNNKDAWATYRQALRDVTKQPGFPFEVVWPVPPT